MILLFLFAIYQTIEGTCVQTAREWSLFYDETPSDTLCGLSWKRLLSVDVIHMRVRENQMWTLVAHQYIATRLNLRTLHPHQDNMTESLLFIADSLELYCDNVSQWQLIPILEQSLLHLFHFNQGNLQSPSCTSLTNLTEREDSFFYFNSIDTVVVRDPLTNQTFTHSEYNGILNTNTISLGTIGILVCIILACFLARAIDKSQHKKFRWSEKLASDAKDYELLEIKKQIGENDMNQKFSFIGQDSASFSVVKFGTEITTDEIEEI